MKIRDSLSWKAIWESKEKSCCSSLKIHIVPYYSKKKTQEHTHNGLFQSSKLSRDLRRVEESGNRGHKWHSWQEVHHRHPPWPKLHTYLWAHLHKRGDSSSLFWHLVQPVPEVIFRWEAFLSAVLLSLCPGTYRALNAFLHMNYLLSAKLWCQVHIISCYKLRTASDFRMTANECSSY